MSERDACDIEQAADESPPTDAPDAAEYEDRRTLTERAADALDEIGENWDRMRGTIGPF